MKKRMIGTVLIPLISISVMFSSCTLFAGRIDQKTGFTEHLSALETHIRGDDWDQAMSEREESLRIWHRIKPLMQIDADHDYVNLIEDYFVMLQAYLETQDKAEALSMILLIRSTWENMSVM